MDENLDTTHAGHVLTLDHGQFTIQGQRTDLTKPDYGWWVCKMVTEDPVMAAQVHRFPPGVAHEEPA